jgi:hypothetical protein
VPRKVRTKSERRREAWLRQEREEELNELQQELHDDWRAGNGRPGA